jgi:hypothetical protein
MANLDFYAAGDDLRELVAYIFSETDIVVYESASEYDREVRQFRSVAELEAVFQLGAYRAGYLQLWSPSVMAHPVIRRVELNRVPGHTFRYDVEGVGLIQLYLDGIRDGVVYHTHYGHWNEAGARARSTLPADACDWRALVKLSGRIQRHIRRRRAVAKLYSLPILRHCLAMVQQGAGLWYGPDIHHAKSENLVVH